MSKVIGIDVSKETFDVAFEQEGQWQHKVYANSAKGFKEFTKQVSAESHCVMEASGPYYLPLASYLFNYGCKVSVVNPLIIKRYAQMQLSRAKTDKKDAQIIARYAHLEQPAAWVPDEEHIHHMRQLFTAIQGFDKQIQISQRQLESFLATGDTLPILRTTLKASIKALKTRKERLENELQKVAKQQYSQTIKRLQTIPGIGPKTAVLLTVITNNFDKFEHSRQLIAYVGLSPRIYQSGTSVKGKGHICKMGSSQVRKQLYMCSWTAKFYNPACQKMYERLKGKGKSERVIKVAIANKLLKQAFALIKNKEDFDKNHIPKPCF